MKLSNQVFPSESKHNDIRDTHRCKIDTAIKQAFDEFDGYPERRAAFEGLLDCMQSHTRLLQPTVGRGSIGWAAPVFLIRRLQNLASRQGLWLRPCECWHPPDENLRPVFRSLASHLLVHYPVPGFMDSVWDLPAGPEGFRQQTWYIRLGRGASFRELNLPLIFTQRMEHYARLAPDHFTVSQALRFGETRGLDGSERLAKEVVQGRLGREIEHAAFWRTVLLFFAARPEMPMEHVNPIVDFIHEQKSGGDQILTAGGMERRGAPRPDFSIKGRTLNSLLRLVKAWYLDLAHCKEPRLSWGTSGISGYRFLEKREADEEPRQWSIEELLDSDALQAEGRAMRHCVYAYASACHRHKTTIWSMRLRLNGQQKRVATIEVNPRERAIIQVRAKCNQRPGERSNAIIRQWAAWARLRFDLNRQR